MYAIVKTGGKQYKVAVGDKLNIEKLDAEVGATVELPVICFVDGATVEADPAKQLPRRSPLRSSSSSRAPSSWCSSSRSARTTRSCAAIASSSRALKSSPSLNCKEGMKWHIKKVSVLPVTAAIPTQNDWA